MQIGLVCTLARAQPVLKSWVSHHRALGISRFYLFVDDAAELASYEALGLGDVLFFTRGEALTACWQTTPLWDYFKAFADEVYARQCLNVDYVLQRAAADGVDWLVHLDSDELLVIAGRWPSLAAFFEVYRHCDMVQFVNHEAVPEAWHIRDYFAEVTLFKRNAVQFDARQRAVAYEAFGERYFLAYANGKSAARIGGACERSFGAHEFTPAGRRVTTSELCVLHFTQCGFNWYHSKFETLGNFKDQLLGQIDVIENHPFLADSRKATVEGSIHDRTALYAGQIIAQGGLPQTLDHLLQNHVLFRLPAPVVAAPTSSL